MRRPARTLCLLLALGLAGCASPVVRASWVRARTAHFELLSSADADRTREIARGLELFRAVFERLGGEVTLEPRIPTLVYVFGSSKAFRRLRPRSDVAGFMLQTLHRNFLAIDASRAEQALAIAYHEYIHFVLRNGPAVRYPLWYDEGFAEMLSTLRVEDGLVQVGRVPSERADWLVYGAPLGLRVLMTTGALDDWDDGARQRFYAQAWALTHFLHWSHRQGFPERHAAMVRYLTLQNRGVPPETAAQQAFGAGFEELEADFLRYVAERQIPFAKIPLARFETPERLSIEPIPSTEALFLVGDLALAVGNRGEAAALFGAALEADPDHAAAHAALARALPAGDARRAQHAARAEALGERDPAVLRRLAEAALDEAAGATDPARARARILRARERLERSIALDPGQVAAYGLLGASFVGQPEPVEEGLAALETARQRLPSHPSLGLWQARLHLQRGETDAARARLAVVQPPAHGGGFPSLDRAVLEEARRAAGLTLAETQAAPHLEARLHLEQPGEAAEIVGLTPLVEVKGRGGLWESMYHDVVIAIDESNSTLRPSGADVDGDGEVGHWRGAFAPHQGDSIIRAELAAARALIEQFDPATTRVALLSFAGASRVRAPLGLPEAALAALDAYEVYLDITGTNLAEAMDGAVIELARNRDRALRRQPTVLLLSDGYPTVPNKSAGRREALRVAGELGGFGVPVHAFALGEEVLEEPDFYRQVAQRSGGRFVPVADPGDVVRILAEVRITGLADVSMTNLETGADGRAVRVFADGSFDGYLELVPGPNRLEVRAELQDGRVLRERRTVVFGRPEEPDELALRRAAELRRRLETKAVEAELLREMRRRRAAGRLELELEDEAEPAGGGP